MKNKTINDIEIKPGQTQIINIPLTKLYSQTDIEMPVQVICGTEPGPTLFVSAAIHGDEIAGVEIIHRLLRLPLPETLHGTLITVPIVNLFGFISHSRYLPDRRDLNRSFPGSSSGSLTSMLANLFVKEIVNKSDYGIDLHTGAINRCNLPHIRAYMKHNETQRIAYAFGTPIPEGSLRQTGFTNSIPIISYESGEALRFDETSIRAGLNGILSVMREIDMLPKISPFQKSVPYVADTSVWIRSPVSGILSLKVELGDKITENESIGFVYSPIGGERIEIFSRVSGIIIGKLNLPLVYEGDALCHVASFESPEYIAQRIKLFRDELDFDTGNELIN